MSFRRVPVGIPPFHFDNGADEFFLRPLWARPTSTLRREQLAVLALPQQVVEIQQSGKLQHNGRTDKTCRANEQGTQTGDDPIRSAQLGRMFATAILRSAADGGPARIRQPMRKPRILAMVSRHQSRRTAPIFVIRRGHVAGMAIWHNFLSVERDPSPGNERAYSVRDYFLVSSG